MAMRRQLGRAFSIADSNNGASARRQQLSLRRSALSRARAELARRGLVGTSDYADVDDALQLVSAQITAHDETGWDGVTPSAADLDGLEASLQRLQRFIAQAAATKQIIELVTEIAGVFAPQAETGVAAFASPTLRRVAMTDGAAVDGASARRQQLSLRRSALSRARAELARRGLVGTSDYADVDDALQLVSAQITAHDETGWDGVTPSAADLDGLEASLQRLQSLIAQSAATKAIVDLALDLAGSLGGGEGVDLARESRRIPGTRVLLAHDVSQIVVRDGRWRGEGSGAVLELRLDRSGQATASGDLGIRVVTGTEWVASFRTPINGYAAPADDYPIQALDRDGRTTRGRLALLPVAADELIATLSLEQPLEGFATGTGHRFVARWEAAGLRRVEIVWQCETAQKPPVPVALPDGRQLSVADAFAGNRLEATMRKATSTLATPAGGRWGTVDILTESGLALLEQQLEGAVELGGDRFPARPTFRVDALCLGRSTRAGLLGIMFDVADELPRQGAAIFMAEIRDLSGLDADRNILRTTVHEIGHALNLAHRFEPDVGRPDSLSFMNYPHRFSAGEAAYWQEFGWHFDTDELAFLCHAPWPQVVPGGLPFRSVSYWRDASDGMVPFRQQSPSADVGFNLELLPPQRDAQRDAGLLEFGAPVFLGIRLTSSGRSIDVPEYLLDPKAGFLEVRFRRRLPRGAMAPFETFLPVMTRCFDLGDPVVRRVARGKPLEDNLQLTYGGQGFPFAEPGRYEVEAELRIEDRRGQPQRLRSNCLKLRVLHPRDKQDEIDAVELFRPQTGVYFALGGAKVAMPKTHERLRALDEQRVSLGRETDAVVAGIRRARGIDSGRRYRYEIRRAVDLLGQLDDSLLNAFDPITAWATQNLLKKQQARLAKDPNAPLAPKEPRPPRRKR